MVEQYLAPAILKVIDPSQFGGIPRSSFTCTPISMVHKWSEATTGNTVSVLFDYQKAFDLIDHRILAGKIMNLSIPSII